MINLALEQKKQVAIDAVQFLIVDDHGFARHIVGEILKAHRGLRCAFAQDGAEAMRFLKATPQQTLEPPAHESGSGQQYCVITDFKMGSINGLHLLKAVRCGETRVPRNTPVIMMTGFSHDYVVGIAMQLDVNAIVVKPISHKALWQKLERALKSSAAIQDAAVYRKVIIPSEADDDASSRRKPEAG